MKAVATRPLNRRPMLVIAPALALLGVLILPNIGVVEADSVPVKAPPVTVLELMCVDKPDLDHPHSYSDDAAPPKAAPPLVATTVEGKVAELNARNCVDELTFIPHLALVDGLDPNRPARRDDWRVNYARDLMRMHWLGEQVNDPGWYVTFGVHKTSTGWRTVKPEWKKYGVETDLVVFIDFLSGGSGVQLFVRTECGQYKLTAEQASLFYPELGPPPTTR